MAMAMLMVHTFAESIDITFPNAVWLSDDSIALSADFDVAPATGPFDVRIRHALPLAFLQCGPMPWRAVWLLVRVAQSGLQ